jgi:hypothetical protein
MDTNKKLDRQSLRELEDFIHKLTGQGMPVEFEITPHISESLISPDHLMVAYRIEHMDVVVRFRVLY